MITASEHYKPNIAIIGGGPAGLCLANILLQNNIPFTVYESDQSPYERNQGGTLDIHPGFGQKAIRAAGLWDEFVKRARPEADVLKIVNQQSGEVLWDGNTSDKFELPDSEKFSNRPEIDRELLQEMLVERLLGTKVIQWGKRLREVVPAKDGQYNLHFKDGTIDEAFDIVVGADGAWSHVRRLLTDKMPEYSGITAVEFCAHDVDARNPWLSGYVGAGSCFSFGEGRAVLMQRLGNGTVRAYACIRKPESFYEESGIDWDDLDSVQRKYLNTYFGNCSKDLKRALYESRDKIAARKLYMLPVGFRWLSKAGVTLLGDAAHLMTPFAGVGVNAALADAYSLGRKIVDFVNEPCGQSIGDITAAYEKEMFPRAEAFARRTYKGLVGHFSADGNAHLVKRLRLGVKLIKTRIALRRVRDALASCFGLFPSSSVSNT